MATFSDPVAASLDTVPSRKERLQKAFSELETLSSCSNKWKELEEHFANVEKAVQKRHQDLADKERALQVKAQEMEAALKKREDAIRSTEENSLSLVQEQKDLAITDIIEERRKWQEAKKMPKQPAVKINAKSSNKSLNRAGLDLTPSKPDGDVDPDVNKEDNNTISMKPVSSNVKVSPLLKSVCEKMDSAGVRKFIEVNIKNINAVNTELPAALKFAVDPSRLVLEALKDYPLEEKDNALTEKKAFGASLTRRAFVIMLEALTIVLTDPVLGEGHVVVPSNTKDKAKALAETWKSEMDIFGDYPHKSVLNAQAFLQLLAAFGLVEHYDEESLCKLITLIARRKQTPALCKALRMTHKIPDVVDKLAEQGKQFDALLFAHSCGIMDRVQPVSLLKTFLKEARKSAQEMLKSRNASPSAQNDAGMKELLALKAVVRIIAEYKLESQYPSAPLQRRVEQLEKAKLDRKRAAAVVKAQGKRPRARAGIVGGYTGSALTERSPYKTSDRTQFGGSDLSYTTPGQSSYDVHGQAGYSAAYGGASRTPISLSDSPLLGSLFGSPLYTSPSATYSSYQFGSGLPPPPPAYQAAFLH